MKVLSVVGISGSGKTTTVENIVGELVKRGMSVGSVKDIHFEDFAIDTPGTNTDRHRQAGAQPVTARGLHETDILFSQRLGIYQLLSFYSQDWVVLEGAEDCNCPTIVCAEREEDIDKLITPTTLAVAGVVSNEGRESYKGLPVFNAVAHPEKLVSFLMDKVPDLLPDFSQKCCGLCGMSCRELLEAIVAGRKTPGDCLLESQVQLSIGGRKITIVPFVQEVLARSLTGIVSTLDGYQPNQEISIRIKPK